MFELWFTWSSPLYSVQGRAVLLQGMPAEDSAQTQEDLRVNCGVGENAEGGEISWENSASESGESEDHVEVAEVGWTEAQVTVSSEWKEKGDDLLYAMLPKKVAEKLRKGANAFDTCQVNSIIHEENYYYS